MRARHETVFIIDEELSMDSLLGGKLMPAKSVVHFPSYKLGTYKKPAVEPGRNRPCPCGSGCKYKNCCLEKKLVGIRAKVVEVSRKNQEVRGL